MAVKTMPNTTSAEARTDQIRRQRLPSSSIVQPATKTAAKIMTHSEGTAWRRLWAGGAVALVLFGIVFTATRVNLTQLHNELRFRGDSHTALEHVLRAPAVATALRCGPLYVPNHKLIPDVRWILDRPKAGVLARSNVRSEKNPAPPPAKGVVILVHGRPAIFKQALVTPADEAADNLPPAGYDRAATSRYYSAYVNC